LVEIAADFIHPESHESITQILSNCKDNSKLTKIQDWINNSKNSNFLCKLTFLIIFAITISL
jgi:hypothetical protein